MLKKKKNPFLEQFTLYSVLHKFNYDLPDTKDLGDTQTDSLFAPQTFKSLLLGRNFINIKRTRLVVEQGDVHMPPTWMAERGRRAGAPGGPQPAIHWRPTDRQLISLTFPVAPSRSPEGGEHNLNRRIKSVPSHRAKPWSLRVSSNPGPRSDALAKQSTRQSTRLPDQRTPP